MIKSFLIGVSILFTLVLFVIVHYVTSERLLSTEKLECIVQSTKITSPSLSVSYYEPRILFRQRANNPAYPQMEALNKMEFVYAQ